MLSPKWETWPNLYDLTPVWKWSNILHYVWTWVSCLECVGQFERCYWKGEEYLTGSDCNLTVHTVLIWPNSHFHKIWHLAPSTTQLTSRPISDIVGKTHTMLTQNWTPANLSTVQNLIVWTVQFIYSHDWLVRSGKNTWCLQSHTV